MEDEDGSTIEVNFSKHQKLPEGYKVLWFVDYEQYGFFDGKENYIGYCDRWFARREAWKNFIKKDKMAAINNLK